MCSENVQCTKTDAEHDAEVQKFREAAEKMAKERHWTKQELLDVLTLDYNAGPQHEVKKPNPCTFTRRFLWWTWTVTKHDYPNKATEIVAAPPSSDYDCILYYDCRRCGERGYICSDWI